MPAAAAPGAARHQSPRPCAHPPLRSRQRPRQRARQHPQRRRRPRRLQRQLRLYRCRHHCSQRWHRPRRRRRWRRRPFLLALCSRQASRSAVRPCRVKGASGRGSASPPTQSPPRCAGRGPDRRHWSPAAPRGGARSGRALTLTRSRRRATLCVAPGSSYARRNRRGRQRRRLLLPRPPSAAPAAARGGESRTQACRPEGGEAAWRQDQIAWC
eukprot:119709-Chlamydomonas_euryale.AAC.6